MDTDDIGDDVDTDLDPDDLPYEGCSKKFCDALHEALQQVEHDVIPLRPRPTLVHASRPVSVSCTGTQTWALRVSVADFRTACVWAICLMRRLMLSQNGEVTATQLWPNVPRIVREDLLWSLKLDAQSRIVPAYSQARVNVSSLLSPLTGVALEPG